MDQECFIDMIYVAYEPPLGFLLCAGIHTYSFDLMFSYFLRIDSQVGTDRWFQTFWTLTYVK